MTLQLWHWNYGAGTTTKRNVFFFVEGTFLERNWMGIEYYRPPSGKLVFIPESDQCSTPRPSMDMRTDDL